MERRTARACWFPLCPAVLAGLLLLPAAALAQAPSSIDGLVTDATGAVLPGVTVEAASPALIEQSRAVVTDSQGRYSIIDLRPGDYTVTFTLIGFNTVVREGVQLSSGFTATINAELAVGSLEETVTVTGESPVVDVQNTRAQQVLTSEVIDTIPNSRGFSSFIQLTPGLTVANPTFQDVGGNQNENAASGGIWGGRDREFKISMDGMHAGNLLGAGGGRSRGIMLNMAIAEEANLNLGGAGAEHEVAGVLINLIPKEGGNDFSGSFLGNYTNDSLQSDNLTQSVIDRGLNKVNKIDRIWDMNGTLGGPIFRNRLWFFGSWRYWGKDKQIGDNYWNATQGTPVYTPDMSRPVVKDVTNRDISARLTWQASERNKFNFYHTDESIDFQEVVDIIVTAPEAANRYRFDPDNMSGASWTSPISNRLLLEAGVQSIVHHYHVIAQPGVTGDDIGILEQSTFYRYNSTTGYAPRGYTSAYGPNVVDHISTRASVSYVTGSHDFKAGMNTRSGKFWRRTYINQDMSYEFFRGLPSRVVLHSPARVEDRLKLTMGLYAQDQWTVDRLTLNLGVRYDYHNGYIPQQDNPATRWLPATSFARVDGVPIWHDISPRLGGAYDLFGDGKTAIKASLGRYVLGEGLGFTGSQNPLNLLVRDVFRTWDDANGNFYPDCVLTDSMANGECGAYANRLFGLTRAGTAYADDIVQGFAVRPYNWMLMAEVDQELLPNFSLHAGYIRRWYGNFRVTDNLLVGPDDYDPYSFMAPGDPKLPGSGGFMVDGVYDLNPAKFGQVSNLVAAASNYGDQSEVHNFINVTINARFPNGSMLSGGFDTGTTTEDACFVVDSPEALRHCRVTRGFGDQMQFKMLGTLPLPLDFQISANYQDLSTVPIQANYRVSNSDVIPSLGRNLSAGSASVPLLVPYSEMLNRVRQFDFRLTKLFQVEGARVELQFDLYNAFNANPTLAFTNRYGPRYLVPVTILDGRIIKFGAQLTF